MKQEKQRKLRGIGGRKNKRRGKVKVKRISVGFVRGERKRKRDGKKC